MEMNKLAVIVPYRDRKSHLERFIPHMKQFLESKNINYKIFIIEQDETGLFNKGILMNIGFHLAKEQNCDYFDFHDVDTLPVDRNLDFTYPVAPRHLYGPDHCAGGCLLISKTDYESVNGYSNLYSGWGREDVDFLNRLHHVGLLMDQTKKVPYLGSTNEKEIENNGWIMLPHQGSAYLYLDEKESEECLKGNLTYKWFWREKVPNLPNWKIFDAVTKLPNFHSLSGLSTMSYIVKQVMLDEDHVFMVKVSVSEESAMLESLLKVMETN